MRRWVALGVSVAALMASGPACASADSLTLSVAAGANDAPNGMSTTASWTLANPSDVYTINVHDTQSGPCAADPGSDGGAPLYSLDGTQLPNQASGSQTGQDQLLPGRWLLCGWLEDANTGTLTTTSLTVTVASGDTLALSISPAPVEGRMVSINATGVNNDRGAVLALHQAPGAGGCGASPQTDPGTEVISDVPPGGTGPYTAILSNTSIFSSGTWRLCAWLTDQATSTVLAGTEEVITVPGLGAKLSFSAPGAIAQQSNFPFTLHITIPSNVPVTAIVDVFNKAHWTSCPAKPEAAPRNNEEINQEVNDTSAPTGSIALNAKFSPSWSGGVLLCGWLEDAWSTTVPAPVVAGPVAATITQVGNFIFRGHTSQQRPMTIFATPFARAIVTVSFTAHLRCNGTPRLSSGARWNGVTHQAPSYLVFGAIRPDGHGRFAIRLTGNLRHVFTLTGRVSGKTITGTFTERGRSSVYTRNTAQNLSCASGVVHFSLHRP